jgi:hypothetical protein
LRCDDLALPLHDERTARGACAEEVAIEVGGAQAMELLGAQLEDRLADIDTSIVDQDMEAAEALDYAGEQTPERMMEAMQFVAEELMPALR